MFDFVYLLPNLSHLTEVSVAPKPIERQPVSICLQVFSENTHTALLANPSLNTEKVKNTAAIYKVLQWWKNVNVKTCGAVSRNNDQYRAPIHDPEDQRLLFCLNLVKWL